ncbi:MAG: NRDE family protein, partial [Comamonadaceae bacterium]|nr:NRDE family protein [Comamonadaceae bacterium]
MCLAAFALNAHPRFPLVIAANRDEFFARPAAPMAWWSAGAIEL